jgi:hypothetical protein
MAKTTQQKEAALIWHAEQQEAEAVSDSISKAACLYKIVREVGSTKNEEWDEKLRQIRALAGELEDQIRRHRDERIQEHQG